MKMPFRHGGVVEGEYFCPRPNLERQLRDYAEAGQDLVMLCYNNWSEREGRT